MSYVETDASGAPVRLHLCTFQEGPDVKRRTKYETVKRAVLAAGRFSVFEACDNPTAAKHYTRLVRDPEVEVETLAFPWTAVRLRATREAAR